ncbi:tetratricopeptide repeat protein [Undibacterium sp. Di26W]|uniref:tetratricopeptide repeat protein n=1 Tax=Undibacterium sp. Di26W TaxID=3413035 RepID=UPI003BEF7163
MTTSDYPHAGLKARLLAAMLASACPLLMANPAESPNAPANAAARDVPAKEVRLIPNVKPVMPVNFLEVKEMAARGYLNEQLILADMYETGRGVRQDDAEAFKWALKAAQQRHLPSQNTVGIKYAMGTGTPKDMVKAYMWFTLGAMAGELSPVENRFIAAKMLTPEQKTQAEALAVTCWNSSFKNCP